MRTQTEGDQIVVFPVGRINNDNAREFEEETYDPAQATMHPTPDVKYQVRLQYLSKLCELICDKFNEEFEQW